MVINSVPEMGRKAFVFCGQFVVPFVMGRRRESAVTGHGGAPERLHSRPEPRQPFVDLGVRDRQRRQQADRIPA
jgi:hypothetical protein